MVLKCTNYRNPTYPKTVGSFTMKVTDREALANDIIVYQDWSMTISALTPITLNL